MKKLSLWVSLALITLGVNGSTFASNQTASLGYAQSRVETFKDIRGVNLKYRYEWDSPLSLMSAFTWMNGSGSYSPDVGGMDIIDGHAKVKYYSLAVGPAWRFSAYISAYGLLGVNYNKVNYREGWYNYEGRYVFMGERSLSEKKASLMYAAGIQINPADNVALDIGYEGSRLEAGDKKLSINGFNLNLGYSF
ncbi:Ail/Lom family outer membrane beta-barrel protein [Pantoea sp. KPR_PJ]|uniref:Ail/Lom family outer membrane beta-barrel protein n=1 Tax=Pantoea sp. KPR_PJ TaxID=2738375 RepID=UPI0035292D7E